MSARLRDNNPNIADLSDPYRPTKLAEIFSELYDNQWTNAYTVLEDNIASDNHITVFLLDIVMVLGSLTFTHLGCLNTHIT